MYAHTSGTLRAIARRLSDLIVFITFFLGGDAVSLSLVQRAAVEQQHEPARQAGGEHQHSVGDGGRSARPRAQARGERPSRDALTRAPATDVRQRHGHDRDERQRQKLGRHAL